MREDRHADENYCPSGVGLAEFTKSILELSARSPRPQRIHDHEHGQPCTGACRVIGRNGGQAA